MDQRVREKPRRPDRHGGPAEYAEPLYEGTPIADLLPIEPGEKSGSASTPTRTQEYPATLD